jgi:hypothetical protein
VTFPLGESAVHFGPSQRANYRMLAPSRGRWAMCWRRGRCRLRSTR